MLRNRILAAALGLATLLPLAAAASTVSGNIMSGSTKDILTKNYSYVETFRAADNVNDAGTRTFTFTNNTGFGAKLLLSTSTVNALTAMFRNGVTFHWSAGATDTTVAQGTTSASFRKSIFFGAGATRILTIAFGDVVGRRSPTSGIASLSLQFKATAVPLPAAGTALLAGLGSLAALRRRRRMV